MKKVFFFMLLFIFMAGCGGTDTQYTVENSPSYKDGEPSEIILSAEENGEAVTGLDMTGELEMEKMDHGLVEVSFTDIGDGTYSGDVELPMGGEWLMELLVDGEETGEIIRFQVNEG